jgi:UDP-glucuronate decarboxylase
MDPHDGRVVSNFVRQVGNDEPITVYGSGNQTRSFCYVSDLIAGITSVVSLAANPGHPVNVGNSCEFTVNELTAIVKKLFPLSRSKVTHSPLPKDDPRQRRPDLQRINFLVSGWQPEVTLKDGVYNLANYWYKLGVIKNRPIQ